MMVFPVNTLTSEKNPQHQLHQSDIPDHDYQFEDIFSYKSKKFNISTKDIISIFTAEISSLYMNDDDMVSYAGHVIHLKFNLLRSSLKYSSIKILLLQSEVRSDGSKVQVCLAGYTNHT